MEWNNYLFMRKVRRWNKAVKIIRELLSQYENSAQSKKTNKITVSKKNDWARA